MKRVLLTLTFFAAALLVQGQTVGKLELKETGFGEKKLAKAPKRIYIAEFNVNYQITYSSTSIARGGSEIGGGYRGDAKATLSVAVPGIDFNELQQITDDVYQNYIARLKSEGYEVINAETAKGTDLLSGWEKIKGGEISQAQFPGYLATTPTGRDYFVRRVTKKGRMKNGIFEYATKLSKQLEGATIVKVNLAIPFVEEAEGAASKSLRKTIGGLAKVVIRPNFRLAKYESVQVGKSSPLTVQTNSGYYYMKSLKDQGQVVQNLKKDVEISDVFENKKYKATQKADQDLWGTSNGYFRVFNYDDREIANTQAIACKPEAFVGGARQVVEAYVKASLDGFLAAAK
ncbi:MAG: hypothetical protein Roseis2KO_23280 [Roseivirga sp.]